MFRKPLVLGLAFTAVLILSVILTAAASSTAAAEPITPTANQRANLTESLMLNPTKDSWIDQDAPTTNYGRTATLGIKLSGSGKLTRVGATLVAFDLRSLPSNAVITSATLALNPGGVRAQPLSPDAAFYVWPNAVKTAWSETGVTWNSGIQSSSYGDGRAAYNPAGRTIVDVTNIAQAWAAGTLDNNGILLYPDINNAEGAYAWASRTAANPPKLTITYYRRVSYMSQKDTWVNQNLPSSNYGAETYLRAGKYISPTGFAEVLVDFAPLVSNMGINSATLTFYSVLNLTQNQPRVPAAGNIYVDALLSPWLENSVTWNNKPVSSYRGDPSAAPVFNGFTEFDVTNIVSDWADGTVEKNGFLLRLDPAGTGLYDFFASPSANRASLTVDYVLLPPPCSGLTSASISGQSQGLTNTPYDFTVQTAPAGADQPFTYSWQATDQGGSVTTAGTGYSWSTPGTKSVTVTVSNCGGPVTATHQVVISDPPPSCGTPITGLSIEGPIVASLDGTAAFTATVSPITATTPITFSWVSVGKPLRQVSGAAASDSHSYSWSSAGGKQVSVTAQQCGGSVTTNHNLELMAAADLPDLDMTAIWYETDRQRVAYLLQNQGATTAPAGHTIELAQDNTPLIEESYPQPLAPGAVRVGYLSQRWGCAGTDAAASITADSREIIAELSEANNRQAPTWPCDLFPPYFSWSPIVYTRTETSAVIGWITGEPTTSQLQYSRFSYMAPQITEDTEMTAQHLFTLTGLEPGSSYRLYIVATDQSGLQASSRETLFYTLTPGGTPPVINSFHLSKYPSSYYEFWGLRAELASSQYVDRVEFYMDGDLVGTDYSPNPNSPNPASYDVYISPFELGLTPDEFFARHDFSAKAITIIGVTAQIDQSETIPWEDRQVELAITDPGDGHTVYILGQSTTSSDLLDAAVLAYQLDWGCTWSGFSEGGVVPMGHQAVNCADVKHEVSQVKILVDGLLKSSSSPAAGQILTEKNLSLSGLSVGDVPLTVQAFGSNPQPAELTQTLTIKQGEPDLSVERQVDRDGTLLDVTLVVKNYGTLPAWLDKVEDNITGMVPLYHDAAGHNAAHTASYWFNSNQRREHLTFNIPAATGVRLRLDPGDSYTMTYSVVPILYDREFTAGIGDAPVKITAWNGTEDRVTRVSRPAHLVKDPYFGLIPFSFGYAEAIGAADYLIVTNPWKLFSVYSGDPDLPQLLEDMATLASLRSGVLAYLSSDDKSDLDDLLEPGGAWADAMNPVFKQRDQGYVLIVGETEIIPAYHMGESHFTTWGDTESVDDSDLPYGNTAGSTKRVELVVGRIIGDEVGHLRRALLTPIRILTGQPDYGFSRSRAMVVSGRGSHVTSNFIPTVNILSNVLDDEFQVSKIHFYDYDGGVLEHRAVFSATLPNQDLIMLRGHGSYDGWGSFSDTDVSIHSGNIWTMPRGNTNPIVFSGACRNGNYEAGNDYNLAEAALDARFSGFIGATMDSVTQVNDMALKRFARRWDPGKAVGQTLNHVRWYVWDDDIVYDHGKLWAYEYNLYGDPKMGLGLPAGTMGPLYDPYAGPEPYQRATLSPADAGTMTMTVALPNLEFTLVDGSYQVSLPGGGLMQDPGTYPLPTWHVTLSLPLGERVADVQMAGRSDPLAYAGYPLALASADIDCIGCLSTPVTPQEMGEWHPALDQQFDWSIEELPDGGSELQMRFFPVNYHIASSSLLFYQDITVTIQTVTTTLQIADLDVDRPAWEEGERVDFNLALLNSGPARDAIVQASIRYPTTGDLVDGLPLRTIGGLTGTAGLSLSWESGSTPDGDYTLLVELLDTEGNLLDAAYQEFQLGILKADLDELLASSAAFQPGDLVDLSAAIRNTGTVPLTGTAVFLLTAAGPITYSQQITMAVENLAPGASLPFSAQWDSSGAPAGRDIRLVAHLKYNSTVTPSRVAWINGWRSVYLPAIMNPAP